MYEGSTFAAYADIVVPGDDDSLEEPGDAQTNQDIEHIAPNAIGHCHVSETLSSH